jgi:hypothetical protein
MFYDQFGVIHLQVWSKLMLLLSEEDLPASLLLFSFDLWESQCGCWVSIESLFQNERLSDY